MAFHGIAMNEQIYISSVNVCDLSLDSSRAEDMSRYRSQVMFMFKRGKLSQLVTLDRPRAGPVFFPSPSQSLRL